MNKLDKLSPRPALLSAAESIGTTSTSRTSSTSRTRRRRSSSTPTTVSYNYKSLHEPGRRRAKVGHHQQKHYTTVEANHVRGHTTWLRSTISETWQENKGRPQSTCYNKEWLTKRTWQGDRKNLEEKRGEREDAMGQST
eukprot:6492005-Amphidinium_carterae.3